MKYELMGASVDAFILSLIFMVLGLQDITAGRLFIGIFIIAVSALKFYDGVSRINLSKAQNESK